MSTQSKRSTAEEFWKGMAELKEQMKEQMKDTDRRMKDTDRQLKKTNLWLKEQKKETDRHIQYTNRRIQYLDELFTGQWGKLMESLVKGDLVRLLNEKNIQVSTLAQETSTVFEEKNYEFDIIATNGGEVVVVEVKTTLRMKDVDHFINKLTLFKKIFSHYANKKIYGAIAYLKANEGTGSYSEKQGLFVIRATGNSASIINKKAFKPKIFA